MPRPIAPNTASVAGGGIASAAPIAAAMKGAVHGVATSTASTPVMNAPRWPLRAASVLPSATGPPIAYTPERLSPTASISHAIAATKPGWVNWKPQPAASPAVCAAARAPPSTTNDSTTPSV